MRNLLNKQSLRQLELLEYLYDNSWTTLDAACQTLGYSKMSIRNDIQFLNQASKNFTIKTSKKQGILLSFPINYSRTCIYSFVLTNSIEFKLLETIFFNETHSSESLAAELYISVSTLHRLIKNLNKKLSFLNFSISCIPHKLIGSEMAIRNFMIQLIIEKYSHANYPFSNAQESLLEKMFMFIEVRSCFSLNYSDIDKLKIWTIVTIIRIKNKHTIQFSDTNPNRSFNNLLSNRMIVLDFKKHFNLKLTKPLLNQLLILFSNDRYARNPLQLESIKIKNSRNWHLYDKCKRLLILISDDIGVKIPNFEHVLLHLFNEINMYYGQNHLLFDKKKDFIRNSISQNVVFYKCFLQNYQKIFTTYNTSESQLYNLCYCLLIHWKQLIIELEKKNPCTTIGIFFNSDLEHMNLLCEYIQSKFNQECIVTVIHQRSITQLKKNASQYDIIITNIDGIILPKTPIYCCSLLPTIDDLAVIGKLIREHRLSQSASK